MAASSETCQSLVDVRHEDGSSLGLAETDLGNGTKIKVIVRVRPLLPREMSDSKECLVEMPPDDPQTTQLRIPIDSSFYKKLITRQTGDQTKNYKFDESIWSYNVNDLNYVDNRKFYEKSGKEILEHIFQGYNVCLLAYGQTSSGKTYTMMGDDLHVGLIPQLVRDILKQKELLVNEKINCEIKFSYMEIYNELTNDLLSTKDDTKKCRVREHPISGPYVENLTEFKINDYQDFSNKLNFGNENRATARTGMNKYSSRSHAILTITLKQTIFKDTNNDQMLPDEEIISNIKLVDLAGSERLLKTKVFGQQDRMKEGNLINKSLTVLGRCINMLATNLSNPQGKPLIIPYRDSILTYILKENLSGNSKTFMIFCISPIDFEETYQTLNYASQVKKITTIAKTNAKKLPTTKLDWDQLQKPEDDAIASLKQEIETLTNQLNQKVTTSTNVSNLIQYLEKESVKLRFENKYLKQKNQMKDQLILELNNHMDYLEREYNYLNQKYSNLQISTTKVTTDSIFSQANHNLTNLKSSLNKFDPDILF